MTAHDPRVTLTEAEARRVLACLPRGSVVRHDLFDVVADLIAARLAPIRALAEDPIEECEVHTRIADGCEECSVVDALHWYAGRLRAALDATGADLSASQDHDGAEGGQGEGERPGEAHADGCGTCHGLVWCPVCEDEREAEHWANEWKKAPNE